MQALAYGFWIEEEEERVFEFCFLSLKGHIPCHSWTISNITHVCKFQQWFFTHTHTHTKIQSLFCLEPQSCNSQKGVASRGWNFTSCISQVSHLADVVDCSDFTRHHTSGLLVKVSGPWKIRPAWRGGFCWSVSWCTTGSQEVYFFFFFFFKSNWDFCEEVVSPLCGLNSPGRSRLFEIIRVIF